MNILPFIDAVAWFFLVTASLSASFGLLVYWNLSPIEELMLDWEHWFGKMRNRVIIITLSLMWLIIV